ncbi:MAG TPA: hypothetical protein DCE52_04910 [Rhodobacteraceae bacterium]|nr:hypothetical protein [Paracoccaceae bacterium]
MIKKAKSLLAVTTACFTFGTTPVNAGIPVVDPAAIAQLISVLGMMEADYGIQTAQLQKQLEELQTAYTQIEKLQGQLDALTGAKGITDILNALDLDTINDPVFRSIRNVGEALESGDYSSLASVKLPDGTSGSDIADNLLSNVNLSQSDIQEHAKSENYNQRSIAKSAGTGVALSVQAQSSYQNSDQYTQAMEQISKQIDKTEDVKASTDLGTLATVNLGYQIAELIKLEASSANAAAQGMMMQAGSIANAAKYTNFSIPE